LSFLSYINGDKLIF